MKVNNRNNERYEIYSSNKDAKTTVCYYHVTYVFQSYVSIVDFEQLNTDWVTFVTEFYTTKLRIFLKCSFVLTCKVIYGNWFILLL